MQVVGGVEAGADEELDGQVPGGVAEDGGQHRARAPGEVAEPETRGRHEGDVLRIEVGDEQELSGEFTVSDDGTIIYPLLGLLKVAEALKPLARHLHKSDDAAAQAALALGRIGDRRAVPPLIRALADPDEDVTALAAEALERLGGAGSAAYVDLRSRWTERTGEGGPRPPWRAATQI